jgi:hypothetical protein
MTADELKAILDLHRKWRNNEDGGRCANLVGAYLRDANLGGAYLVGAYLRDANLGGADLRGADLRGANLVGAYLRDANLGGADLRGADLRGANLWGAYLVGAYLRDANLGGAYLGGADLRGADLRGANLWGANLMGASGNLREVKSAQFDTWPITWTCAPDGVTTLQIGCQRHPLDLWIKSDPRWIAAMDDSATEWWGKYRDVVLALVQASPATPWGAVHAPETRE